MKTIRQTATIRGATPHDVYETIMDSKRHSKLSQQRATVSRRVGGAFRVGHDLEGKQLALTKDKKIVQTWRANNWPKGTGAHNAATTSPSARSFDRLWASTKLRITWSKPTSRHRRSRASSHSGLHR